MTPVVRSLAPILSSTDLPATLAFLVERLGFTEPWTVDDESSREPVYAGVSLGEYGLHLQPCEREVTGMQAYFEIDDADGYHARLTAAGANPTAPEDQFYGMRDFGVRMPGGALIGFGSKIQA